MKRLVEIAVASGTLIRVACKDVRKRMRIEARRQKELDEGLEPEVVLDSFLNQVKVEQQQQPGPLKRVYTCARGAGKHGDVLNVHTEAFLKPNTGFFHVFFSVPQHTNAHTQTDTHTHQTHTTTTNNTTTTTTHTTQHNTTHNNTRRQRETERETERDRERQRKKTEKEEQRKRDRERERR